MTGRCLGRRRTGEEGVGGENIESVKLQRKSFLYPVWAWKSWRFCPFGNSFDYLLARLQLYRLLLHLVTQRRRASAVFSVSRTTSQASLARRKYTEKPQKSQSCQDVSCQALHLTSLNEAGAYIQSLSVSEIWTTSRASEERRHGPPQQEE